MCESLQWAVRHHRQRGVWVVNDLTLDQSLRDNLGGDSGVEPQSQKLLLQRQRKHGLRNGIEGYLRGHLKVAVTSNEPEVM